MTRERAQTARAPPPARAGRSQRTGGALAAPGPATPRRASRQAWFCGIVGLVSSVRHAARARAQRQRHSRHSPRQQHGYSIVCEAHNNTVACCAGGAGYEGLVGSWVSAETVGSAIVVSSAKRRVSPRTTSHPNTAHARTCNHGARGLIWGSSPAARGAPGIPVHGNPSLNNTNQC